MLKPFTNTYDKLYWEELNALKYLAGKQQRLEKIPYQTRAYWSIDSL